MAKRIGSPAQERVRTAFKEGVAFLAPLNALVRKGFAEKARRKKSFAASLALGELLLKAINMTDDQPRVDPTLVILSDGVLTAARVEQINRFPDRIEVSHNWFPAYFSAGDDRLILCAYQVDKGYAFINEQNWSRQEGKVIAQIPKGYEDDDFHLYLMVSDRTGNKYARSQYLGYSTI